MSNYFDLAPYQSDGLLHTPSLRYKHLKLMRFLVEHVIQAVSLFYIEKKYSFFDPHVGDTLCQIRTAQLLEIARYDNQDAPNYIIYLKSTLQKIDSLLPIYENFSQTRRKKDIKNEQDHSTLENFVNDNKLDFHIPADVEVITKIYLLSRYKIHSVGCAPRINYEELCDVLNVSKDFCCRLVKFWQRSLAEHSCNYVKYLLKTKSNIVEHLKRQDDDNREVLPCYFVMKVIFSELIQKQVPILLVVRNPHDDETRPLVVSYKAISDSTNFITSKNINMNVPHFVIWGISGYITNDSPKERLSLFEMLNDFGIGNILLSSVAHHPQFSGKKLERYNDNPYECLLNESLCQEPEFLSYVSTVNNAYNNSKKIAMQSGCNIFHDTFIYAEHMLFGTPNEQLETFGIDEYYIFNQMLPERTPQPKYPVYKLLSLKYAKLAEAV